MKAITADYQRKRMMSGLTNRLPSIHTLKMVMTFQYERRNE